MVNGNQQLPDGWTWTTVEDIGIVASGQTPKGLDDLSGEGMIPFYKVSDMNRAGNETQMHDSAIYLSEKEIKQLKIRTFDVGTVIFPKRGGAIATNKKRILSKASGVDLNIMGVTPQKVSSKYFYYWLSSIDLATLSDGSNVPQINHKDISPLSIPLAPPSEQKRIVAKIEELFTQLEAGTSALERVQAGLRRYKASVLKAAVEGRLLNVGADGIRPDHGRLPSSGRTPSARTGELPEGWRLVKMEEIAETIGGATKGRKLEGKATITLPYLRVANVQRGRLELEVMKEIEILKSEIEKYRLLDGDVVLTEGGDWDKLGRSAIWRNQIPNCIHQNHIFRARVKSSDALPEWLMYYTNSEPGQDYFKESSKQTTNLASINLTQLRACPIPLPPLEEQRRIVAEVERRLSVAREVESVVEKALARSVRLRQAVLKSAFEGRLVNGL